MKKKVLFVCSGNICRSPCAEAVFRELLKKHDMSAWVEADSAGFESYHVGDPPDRRAQQAAAKRGYNLSNLRARKITLQDFEKFDLILGMDKGHLAGLKRHAPPEHLNRIKLFMAYAKKIKESEVPDPYYGDIKDFEKMLDMVEDASEGLIEALKKDSIKTI